MCKINLLISGISNYEKVLSRQKKELLEKATLPTFVAYTNPNGADIQALNKNIRILASTKCQISKDNLEFVLLADRSGVSLRLTNFSIKNLSGIGAEVKFETTGRYNYQEQFTISFNVYSEYLGLELFNPRIVYQDRRLQANKAIESFDVKCVKKTLGLLDWQYKPCNYTLSISEPFYFIDGGRKTNSKRLSSKLGFNTTLNIGLAELSESIIGQDLTPCIKKEGNGYSENSPLSTFRLEYSSIEIKNVQGINLTPIIGETEPIESFDAMFKSVTPHLEPWQNIDNDVEIKINPPFCFQETECDSLKIIAGPSLHQCIHVCLSSETDISYIGKKLIPIVSISAKGIKEEVKLQHPVIIQPKPKPEIEVKFVPELSPFRITDITKDIRMGYLEITNTCNNPLGEDLIIKKIEPSNKCISIEEAVYSPINPGKSAKVTVLKYKSQAFQDLTEEPFSVNCMIIVSSNAGVENRKLELVVTDGTPVGNQDEITIPIIPLPQFNIGITDTIICFDGEVKKEMDLSISNCYDKPRKNVLLSLEDKKGVASLEENSFPEISPKAENHTLLFVDVSKLTLNQPTQVIISAIADYTYKVSKSVTIIKKAKEVAKPKIENFYSEINFIYANGQGYKVSTFEIVNDTQSASEIEAESADITSLRVEMTEKEKTGYSAFFRIEKPKDVLKPQERVKCVVMLKIEREKFDKDSDYFSYRPVCDKQINYEEAQYQTQSMSINRQKPVEKSKISFEPERNNGYDPKDNSLLVGTIVLHEKMKNPDHERYYDRVKEAIGIVDEEFFIINEEGVVLNDLQTFGIEEKRVKLYWKVLGRENVFMDISLPIHYYCENVPEENDKLISEVYESNFIVKIYPKEQPVALQIRYGSCTDKKIEDYNPNELACVKVKYNEKQKFRRSPCIHIELSNKANIAYKDNRLTIEKVSINEEDLFSIRNNNLPCDINSGAKDDNGEEKKLSIIVDYDRKLCLERVQSSPHVGMSVNIEYSINGGDTKNETLHFQIEFYEQIISSIYSLDYGTTGIVLSKYEGDRVSSVILRDVDYIGAEEQEGHNNNQDESGEPLERDKTIVSSISILKKIRDNNRKASLVLAPSRLEYDQGAVFILSPTKFLIGQPKIPFVDLYAKKFDEIEDFPGHITMIKAEDIIRHSYKNVFERFDHDGVRKLILTYPNTYVPEQIRILREILKDEFKLLDNSNIHFVPESDSVVAYYVEMRRKSPIGFPKKKERILIYDMGAGTLDISYVIISKDQNEYEIQLEKRIGIPVAGNYLDYELYEIIKDEVSDKKTSPRTLKDYIKNYLKVDLSEKENSDDDENTIRDDAKVGQGQAKSYLNTLYPTDLFKGDSKLVKDEIKKKINNSYFIKVCGELIFHVLFPGKKEKWNEEIDTFVLSGRASQFGPLVSKILGKVGKEKIEFLPQLKTCVSEGAIYYQRIKEDPENKKFRFTSHSHYLRLGAIYAIDNKDGGLSYNYCELINPDKAKWEEADDINGTLYVQLEGEGTMNLQRDDDVLFVQTLLSEEDVKNYYIKPMNDALASKSVDKYGEYDCFIHKLFTVSPEGILTNREKIKTEVVIDKDNQVTVNCIDEDENSYELEPQYFVENVENNEYYKRAAWPSNSERL